MGVVVKGLKYVTNTSKVRAHIKYIGFRSNELAVEEARKEYGLDNTRFFSKDENNADYKQFLERIENHKALQHPKSVKMHKMVFSLKQEDYKNYLCDFFYCGVFYLLNLQVCPVNKRSRHNPPFWKRRTDL